MTAGTRSSLAEQRRANGRQAPWKVPFFGVGNELWGCGGNMRVEYAADVYRRYQTFVKAPSDQKILKIAPGPNNDDYHWTEVMMREAGTLMDGLSLHYYTVPGGWPPRASSTDFDEAAWIETLSRTLVMDELITKHSAIMDRYDPAKKVALVVDEWGTWYAGLPGANPGFLHQQNSLRDALVAALNIDIFSAHADRVRMANIAQMINVLQAMILTDGDRMVLTPTYHVFAMYKPFQDATHLPLQLQPPTIGMATSTCPPCMARRSRPRMGMCMWRSPIWMPTARPRSAWRWTGSACAAWRGNCSPHRRSPRTTPSLRPAPCNQPPSPARGSRATRCRWRCRHGRS